MECTHEFKRADHDMWYRCEKCGVCYDPLPSKKPLPSQRIEEIRQELLKDCDGLSGKYFMLPEAILKWLDEEAGNG